LFFSLARLGGILDGALVLGRLLNKVEVKIVLAKVVLIRSGSLLSIEIDGPEERVEVCNWGRLSLSITGIILVSIAKIELSSV